MAKGEKSVLIYLSPEMIEKIDDHRFKNRFPTRNAAIKDLIEKGLQSTSITQN